MSRRTTSRRHTKAYRYSTKTSYAATSYSGSYTTRRLRSKSDWAGITLGDAFKPNLYYYDRLPAQRLFYRWCRTAQQAAVRTTGETVDATFRPSVKPQISPCYTSYPDTLAAPAAIGLTAFLEFLHRIPKRILHTYLGNYLQDPAKHDGEANLDPASYQRLATVVAGSVQTRLLLAELTRTSQVRGFVEIYRQFAAAQQSLRFQSVQSIINAVILYGDLLPDWSRLNLHPATRTILDAVADISTEFFDRLDRAAPNAFLEVGADWVRALCRRLAHYMPALEAEAPSGADAPHLPHGTLTPSIPRIQKNLPGNPQPTAFAPLDAPRPPVLFDEPMIPSELVGKFLRQLRQCRPFRMPPNDPEEMMSEQTMGTAQAYLHAIEQAVGQQRDYEDLRFDLLEANLSDTGFTEGPIQGHPAEGHEVTLAVKGGMPASGELFDRPVELSEDDAAFATLAARAAPLTRILQRTLYPNAAERPVTERLKTSGRLDPARLPHIFFSEAVHQRYRIEERLDRRGSPVLLIAADGSGSLNPRQMAMLKSLTWAWLDATATTDIQVLAGLYHSGKIRPDAPTGPLVQWMYHPHKTPAAGRRDALRALVALPDTGTGVQSDALSLTFMLQEARRLARGRMIYLILLTDCVWNRSFSELDMTGLDEVAQVFEQAYEHHGTKLHSTLVALGANDEAIPDALFDHVIRVPDADLTNPEAVAEEVGTYVASVLRERRRLLAKR